MRMLRWMVPVLAALAALLLLTGTALAARTHTDQVRGIEYSATATVGKFAGMASGALPGTWHASINHEPITATLTAAITGGSFELSSERTLTGRFLDGSVTRLNTPTSCQHERFDVRGNLALDGGGSGQFSIVLTHLRTTVADRCVTYGATVAGTLTLAPTGSAAVGGT